MANTEVPLLYDEYRLYALEKALEDRGTTVQQELKKTLDRLYKYCLTYDEHLEVEALITREQAKAYEKRMQSNVLGVFHLHNVNGDIHFSTGYVKGLLQFARLYKKYMQFGVNQYPVEAAAEYFGERRIIDPELFSTVCDTFHSSDGINVVADVDFENEYVSVLEKGMDDWRTYSFEDILSAVTEAENPFVFPTSDMSDFDKNDIFYDELKGKELEIKSDNPYEGEDQPMQM